MFDWLMAFDWSFSPVSLKDKSYDIPNFLICCFVALAAGRLSRVSALVQFVLLLHCLLPFLLNDMLFPVSYMPDQYKYLHQVNAIRSGELSIFDAWMYGGNVEQASLLMAFMPFPFALSPVSLGFFNKFLYISVFFWLYRKNVFTRFSLWFYLLYPSMALYTGLALRDTLIFAFMVVAVQFAREGRPIAMLLALSPLLAIKFQNFFILLVMMAFYQGFGIRRTGISAAKAMMVLAVSAISIASIASLILPYLNHFRIAMFVEDGGDRSQAVALSSAADLLSHGFFSGFYFFVKPFPWEASNAMQLIQASENIVVALLLGFLSYVAWKRAPRHLVFWLLFLIFSLSVYGLVVFNYGTAARYRFPFLLVFVLFVCRDCNVKSVFAPVLSKSWRLGHESAVARSSLGA